MTIPATLAAIPAALPPQDCDFALTTPIGEFLETPEVPHLVRQAVKTVAGALRVRRTGVLRLLSIAEGRIDVAGVDVLDGTPLLDIKPYVPDFDAFTKSRAGWFDRVTTRHAEADSRFVRNR